CNLSIERVTISGQAFDNLDNARVKIDFFDAEISPTCVPPELRPTITQIGLDQFSLPSVSLKVDYHIPTARATALVLASVSEVAEVSVAADFDYVSVRAPRAYRDTQIIALLSNASVEIHNRGGWQAVSQFVPSAFSNPATAAPAVENILRSAISELNRESMSFDSGDLSVLQLAFISSVTAAWTDFLRNPDQIVLETNIAPDRPVFLNFLEYEDSPSSILRDLNPTMRTIRAPATAIINDNRISQLLSGEWRELRADERLAIGLALARGNGIPRNRALASEILVDIALNGDADAASALAETLETVDPEAAYRWSLVAGAAGVDGTASRLDRLEGNLPIHTVLQLQQQAVADATEPVDLPTSIVGVRMRARGHLTGLGLARNYRAAHIWASLGAALGDPASISIGEELEKILIGGTDARARAAIDELIQSSNETALQLWSDMVPNWNTQSPANVSEAVKQDEAAVDVPDEREAPVSSLIADEELQRCEQLLAEQLPDEYQVGGSCEVNSGILLREVAQASRLLGVPVDHIAEDPVVEADTARSSDEPETVAVAPEPEEVVRLADPAPVDQSAALDAAEVAALDAAENAAQLAVEAAALDALNTQLRDELENSAAQLSERDREIALLSEQTSALRNRLASLQAMLVETETRDQDASVQLEVLGAELNTALARLALSEARRQDLEAAQAEVLQRQAERDRLSPSDAAVLGQARDDFLTRLDGILADRSNVSILDGRLVFSSGALFQSGSTGLSETGRSLVAEIMRQFEPVADGIPPDVDWIIRIDGHTDDIPISSGAFADNWELSQARALSVVRFLIDDLGFAPERLAAVGFGEFRPLNPEATASARAQNRRIELRLTTR
ncbi:MAG: OmpA family protein, partial [Pseudomonadota bacterium]